MQFNYVAKTPLSKRVFKTLASRQRYRQVVDLRRLYMALSSDGELVPRTEFLGIFEDLQKLGAGKLVIGRNNNPDRFHTEYNIRQLSQIILRNKAPKIEAAPTVEAKTTKKPSKITVIKRKPGRPKKEASVEKNAPKSLVEVLNETEVAKVDSKPEPKLITKQIVLGPKTSKEDLQALFDIIDSFNSESEKELKQA